MKTQGWLAHLCAMLASLVVFAHSATTIGGLPSVSTENVITLSSGDTPGFTPLWTDRSPTHTLGSSLLFRKKNATGRGLYLAKANFESLVGTVPALPSDGQQEVAPTWYDPWATPSKQPAKPRVGNREAIKKTTNATTSSRRKRDRAKLPAGRRQPATVAGRSPVK